MPRHRVDPNQHHSHGVLVRLAPAQLAQLDAARGQVPRATWLRAAALSRGAPRRAASEVGAKQWAELARVGANLNQLVHSCNIALQEKAGGQWLLKLLNSVELAGEEVARLRRVLAGAADELIKAED